MSQNERKVALLYDRFTTAQGFGNPLRGDQVSYGAFCCAC